MPRISQDVDGLQDARKSAEMLCLCHPTAVGVKRLSVLHVRGKILGMIPDKLDDLVPQVGMKAFIALQQALSC